MNFVKTMLASMLGSLITIVVLVFLGLAIMTGIILAAMSDDEVEIKKNTLLCLDLNKEIVEHKNVAAAIIAGAVILGVCIIIAASIAG